VRRNQTRDFLDVAALATHLGLERAARVLGSIDEYYQDQRGEGDGVATQLARQLAEPRPRDSRTTKELDRYKRLDARWHDWRAVVDAVPGRGRRDARSGGPTVSLRFRNLDVTPAAPVESWPTEASWPRSSAGSSRTGGASWRRYGATRGGRWHGVSSRPSRSARRTGHDPLLERALARARADAAAAERAEVARRVRALLDASGLSRAAFAESIGTSAPRLSTYLSGKVAPSSTLLVRMERVAGVIDTLPQPPTARR
jgi:hypothetical protein